MTARWLALPMLLASAASAQAPAEPPAAPKPAADAPIRGSQAVIGILNKRLGQSVEFRLAPGQQFTHESLSGTLHACERTAPWETRKEAGAFVQIIETPARVLQTAEPPPPRTIFSGWLFAHSPSLNPLRHPVYDVWLKSCTMDAPDGPKPAAGSARRTSTAAPSSSGTPPASGGSAGGG